MRIVFFGASDLGYRCCERLLEQGHSVVGIFTMPGEFRISYSPGEPVRNVLHRDFSELAARFGVPVVTVDGRMRDHTEALAALAPDLLVVIGWYYMIPAEMRQLAPRGCVGIHASLLPKYRGGAPLVWAIIKGESEAGVTLFHLGDGVDNGDIIAQRRFPIEADDTIREVLARAASASIALTEEFVPRIGDGTAPRVPQDASQATHVPQRKPQDGLIDWSWEPDRIRNFIRAQTKPYPGAFTYVGGKKVTIWSADVETVSGLGVGDIGGAPSPGGHGRPDGAL
jgi:methionyl-tRNA formyltransferase